MVLSTQKTHHFDVNTVVLLLLTCNVLNDICRLEMTQCQTSILTSWSNSHKERDIGSNTSF